MLVASPGFSSPPTLTLPPLGGGNDGELNRWGGGSDGELNRWVKGTIENRTAGVKGVTDLNMTILP